MGLADRLGKVFGWKTEEAKPQPKPKQEPAKAAEPPLKLTTLKQVLKTNEPLPASRAWPGANPQLREALTQKLAEEKGQAKPAPAPKPVEREATKLQPKLQPVRTLGPGPSIARPDVRYVNRTSTAQQQQKQKARPDAPAKPKLADYQRGKPEQAKAQEKPGGEGRPGTRLADYARGRSDGKDLSR